MSHPPSAPRRVLLFTLGGRGYALRASDVKGLADPDPWRTIPGAPPGVAGLVEWRGNILTVLDLPLLLGLDRTEGPPCLIRLAPPMHHAALWVTASVRVAEVTAACEPLEKDGRPVDPYAGIFDHESERVRLIDPRGLVRRAEKLWRERV